MKLLRLFPLELGRLLHSRMTWLIVLLTVISPAVGLVLYKPAIASTMLSMYLANPALAGGAAGGILFGLLTVYELDRAGRSRVEVLTNAVVSPLAAALVRLPALLAAAGLALVLTMLVWLPISCGLIGSIFDGGDYVLAYLLFMGLALPLAILAAFSEPIAQIALSLGIHPLGALYALMMGLDQIFMPHEFLNYVVIMAFGLVSMKDFIKIMTLKTVLATVFVAAVMIPWWYFIGII